MVVIKKIKVPIGLKIPKKMRTKSSYILTIIIKSDKKTLIKMLDKYLNQFNVLYMITFKSKIKLKQHTCPSFLNFNFSEVVIGDWPDVGSSYHVQGDIWLWVQVTIHVWPSLILSNSI